jgi:hypothetical protein
MKTETAEATNTDERHAALVRYKVAQDRLIAIQRYKANGFRVNSTVVTKAHNEAQEAAQALRMPAVSALVGVDFDIPEESVEE